MAGRIILCLGMHRSGTSLIANSLECLGAELGPRAHWAGPDNPKSFGEDIDILSANESLLRFAQSAWDNPDPVIYNVRLPSPFIKFISDRLGQFPIWGLKEPRMCRLLPVWRPVFEEVGCEVSVVHAVRHPMEVARSLYKRNGIPIERGLALWLEYTKRAHEDSDPAWKSVTVSYTNMALIPGEEITRIGAALGLTPNAEKIRVFAKDFVSDDLRHEEVYDDDGLPLDVKMLYHTSLLKAFN
jgi:hypothetical protein